MSFARVEDGDQLELDFSGTIPWDDDVRKALATVGVVDVHMDDGMDEPNNETVRFRVTKESGSALRTAARAFANVTARPYSTPAWKFASREVANDLRTLATQLDDYVAER